MKNVFRWYQMGFVLFNRDLVVHDFEGCIDVNCLPKMFEQGYYFFNPVHRVRIASMEEYNTYVGVTNNEN